MVKAKSCGGVVINDAGCVLLREPRNHFAGYHWTFAQGRPEGDEGLNETAAREILEETGVEVWGYGYCYGEDRLPPILGTFEGTATVSTYFLFKRTGDGRMFDHETWAVGWFDREEAERRIRLTEHEIGRNRDLAILDAAYKAWNRLREGA